MEIDVGKFNCKGSEYTANYGSPTTVIKLFSQSSNVFLINSFQDLVHDLERKGHEMNMTNNYIAVIGSVRSKCGDVNNSQPYCIEAVSDGRKGGVPDGL